MLKRSDVELVRDLSADLAFDRKEVSVLPESPLSLVSRLTQFQVDSSKMILREEYEEDLLTISRIIDDSGINKHTMEMDAIVEELTRRASASVSFARNQLNPIIREVHAKAVVARDKVMNFSEGVDSITLYSRPNLFLNPSFESLLEFSKAMADKRQLSNLLDFELTLEEIKATCKIGIETLDKQVDDFVTLDSIGYGHLAGPVGRAIDSLHSMAQNNPYITVNSVLGLLFLNGVLNGKLEKLPLEDIDSGLAAELGIVRNQFARNVKFQIEAIDKMETGNRIVIPSLSTKYSVAVIERPYRNWIKDVEGAGTEAILAYYEEGNFDASILREDALKLKARYERNAEIRKRKAKTAADIEINRSNLLAVSAAVAELELSDDERIAINQAAKKYSVVKPYYSALDLANYVRGFVADVIAPGTESAKILALIDEEYAANPEISAADASLMAVCDIMAGWIVKQLKVERI